MKIGLNVGYSHTKAVAEVSRQIRTTVFPSVVGTPDAAHWSPGLEKTNGHSISLTRPEAVLIGEDAIEQSRFLQRREDRAWVESKQWYLLALAAMTQLTEGSTDADIVTGLPISYFKDKDVLIDRLSGTHQVQRHGRKAQTITIEKVTVIPESYGTLFDLLWDERGQVQDQDIATGHYGVIDCGGKTTNLLTVKRIREIGRATTSVPLGVWDAVRAMRSHLEDNCTGLELRDHEIVKAIIEGQVKYRGRVVDISEPGAEIITSLAAQIASTAGQLWSGMANLDGIIITGGGAHLFGPYLQDQIDITVTRTIEEPVMANARGFWKYAGYLAGR